MQAFDRIGVGQPLIDIAVRKLIRDMQSANIGWGAPRIHGELLKLGIEIAQDTVSTAAFRVLYVFIVLRFDHYRIVHFNVAEHPSAQWAAQQSDGECYPPIYRKMCNRDLP